MSLIDLIRDYDLELQINKYGTDKESKHSYVSEFYEPLFQRTFYNILEVGTKHGAFTALLALKFPNSTITTIDIQKYDLHEIYNKIQLKYQFYL